MFKDIPQQPTITNKGRDEIPQDKVKFIEVTSENFDKIKDDLKFPEDEAGLREFIEGNKRHHRRGY